MEPSSNDTPLLAAEGLSRSFGFAAAGVSAVLLETSAS